MNRRRPKLKRAKPGSPHPLGRHATEAEAAWMSKCSGCGHEFQKGNSATTYPLLKMAVCSTCLLRHSETGAAVRRWAPVWIPALLLVAALVVWLLVWLAS